MVKKTHLIDKITQMCYTFFTIKYGGDYGGNRFE